MSNNEMITQLMQKHDEEIKNMAEGVEDDCEEEKEDECELRGILGIL